MPGIDGIDTLKRIKSHRESMQVIMITKSEDEIACVVISCCLFTLI